MQSVRNHVRDVLQASTFPGFLCVELNLVQNLFELLLGNSVLLHISQSLEKYVLCLFKLLISDTLNS